MAHAEISNDRVQIVTQFREKDLIRQVPGATWSPVERAWSAPLSWGTCRCLRGVFLDDLTIGPELNEWAWRELNERVNPAMALRMLDHEPVGFEYSDALRRVKDAYAQL